MFYVCYILLFWNNVLATDPIFNHKYVAVMFLPGGLKVNYIFLCPTFTWKLDDLLFGLGTYRISLFISRDEKSEKKYIKLMQNKIYKLIPSQ